LLSGAGKPDRADRVAGGVLGLLVGDALGVPYEFHLPEAIPAADRIEFVPPPGFRRAHGGVPAGTWSDDGAQALCLLASLLEMDAFDPADFARRLGDWYDRGYLAVDAHVYDVGVTTGRALGNLRAGAAPLDAGPADAHDNGNGALMRVLPLALWHRGTDADLVRDARLQSRVTHGHVRSQVCCALYVLWARRILDEAADPWGDALRTLRVLLASDDDATRELEFHVRPDDPAPGRGTGYVVDSIRSARGCLVAGGYESVVRAAVRLGHDTDTTACIAGGLAGLRDGVGAIPVRWLSALRGRDLCDPLIARLVAQRPAR
jgi:ADP-ribosylglycohydrolase